MKVAMAGIVLGMFTVGFWTGWIERGVLYSKKKTTLWISAKSNHIMVQKLEGHFPPIIAEWDSPPEVGYGKAVDIK